MSPQTMQTAVSQEIKQCIRASKRGAQDPQEDAGSTAVCGLLSRMPSTIPNSKASWAAISLSSSTAQDLGGHDEPVMK